MIEDKPLEIPELTLRELELLHREDLFYNLMDRKYWDKAIFGRYRKVQTRQEYSSETCEAIIKLIIRCIAHGCNDKT